MKIRSDFVTNSSSSSYVFIGYFSKDIVDFFKEMHSKGYTYLFDGEDFLDEKGYLPNQNEKAIVDALTTIPHKLDKNFAEADVLGIQVEMAGHDGYVSSSDALLTFLDFSRIPENEHGLIKEKITKLVGKAEKEGTVLKDYGTYSTDAGDFARHFSKKDLDRCFYSISRGFKLEKCKKKSMRIATVYAQVVAIKEDVFANMKKLKEVRFVQPWLNVVGDRAFKNCVELEKVYGFDKVREIKSEAFSGCIKLKEIFFYSWLEKIASNVFADCTALETVVFKSTLFKCKIKENAFKNCTNLKDVWVVGNEITFSAGTFTDCGDFTMHAYADSPAAEYALKNNIKLDVIDKNTTIPEQI